MIYKVVVGTQTGTRLDTHFVKATSAGEAEKKAIKKTQKFYKDIELIALLVEFVAAELIP